MVGVVDPPDELAAGELRTRAVTGAALLGARGVLVYGVGIVANLVLARLLAPRDFGLVALGTTVLVVGTYIAYGGFSAALIRRREPPTRPELEAVFGMQLAIATVIAVGVTAVALPAGDDGLVVATMAASVPLVVLRTPSLIVLERRVEYRVIATADVLEGLVYYAWAVATVAAGMGVWGMATAVLARAVVGTATMMVAGPMKLVRPRWGWSQVRPLLAFGIKYQAAAVAAIGREQLLNVAVAAVAGLATLGVWNLAWRVLQVPSLIFSTVGRVHRAVAAARGARGSPPGRRAIAGGSRSDHGDRRGGDGQRRTLPTGRGGRGLGGCARRVALVGHSATRGRADLGRGCGLPLRSR
jgi:O-antigen/teichoic acid export membrane protein